MLLLAPCVLDIIFIGTKAAILFENVLACISCPIQGHYTVCKIAEKHKLKIYQEHFEPFIKMFSAKS